MRGRLAALDGKGYGAYKRLTDSVWDLDVCMLAIERVQGDPYAPPSRLRVEVSPGTAGFP
ncbi:MAG: ABC-ATPase domain-containing protein, partial [Actinobacteria bacterium]|nr:ABC-ATPase domain-containing protein [Actinomycetota bacterium]